MATSAELRAKLDALTADVAAENTVIGSLSQLVDNLSAQLVTLKNAATAADIPQEIMNEIDALSAAVAQGKQTIVDSVTRNTPAQ